MSPENRLRALAERIETVQEHYKDHEPSGAELAAIKDLIHTIDSLEKLYNGDTR